ncbi:MAG: adenosylmethionine decarboxylase [Nitrospirota bacterium]|nr:adenosylmethionine decarboxylase [Nitrospirota bacterium]
MRNLGVHVLLELNECQPDLLTDVAGVREKLLEAVHKGGATVVGDYFQQFDPYGVSGMIVIAESHVSIHTWPEYGYAAVDVFTCGNPQIPYNISELVIRAFGSQRPVMCEFKRGILSGQRNTTALVA